MLVVTLCGVGTSLVSVDAVVGVVDGREVIVVVVVGVVVVGEEVVGVVVVVVVVIGVVVGLHLHIRFRQRP